MNKGVVLTLISILILICIQPLSSAHVPVESRENDKLEHALRIDDPLKSWAIYDELDCICAVRYYKFDLNSGDRLRVSIFTPEAGDFAPNLVIMYPGITQNATLPYFVEIPENYSTRIISGSRPAKPGYEPFTPSSHYRIIDFDESVNTSGIYFLAVFDPDASGKFGIAIGYSESFTLEEWVLVPFDVVNIHLWEGQNFGTILLPMIIILIFGIELILWRKFKQNKTPKNINGFIGSLGALTFIGTSAMLAYQMILSLSKAPEGAAGAAVTLFFVLIPVLLGVFILKSWLNDKKGFSKFDRLKLIVFGVIGIFIWAGYIVGPILVIVSGILPIKSDDKLNNLD